MMTGQKTLARPDSCSGLALFFPLLALDAETRVRKCIEALERDLLTAVVAAAEILGLLVEATQRLVDVPEETTFLAGEQERLFTLHGIRSLIRHMERVRTQVSVSRLRRGAEYIFVVPELLQRTTPLVQQPLLEVLEVFLRHRLRLLGAVRIGHL